MKIVNRKIADLKFAHYNPRQLTEKQHADLKESLTKFGLQEPIVVNMRKDRENTIIGGHQRVRIWKELGNKTIPTETDRVQSLGHLRNQRRIILVRFQLMFVRIYNRPMIWYSLRVPRGYVGVRRLLILHVDC